MRFGVSKVTQLRKVKDTIEKAFNKEKHVADFKQIVDAAEISVKELKADIQRYLSLEKGYVASAAKRARTSEARLVAEKADADAMDS